MASDDKTPPMPDAHESPGDEKSLYGITERFEKALGFAGINLFRIDPQTGEGSFLYSASGQVEYLPREQWIELVEPEYRELVYRSHDGPGAAIEYAYRPNGPDMPVRWLSQAIIDTYSLPDGRVEYLGFSRDITTERRYTEYLQAIDPISGGITFEALHAVFADLLSQNQQAQYSFFAIELVAYDISRCAAAGVSEGDLLRELYLRLFTFLETEGSIAGSPLSRLGLLVLVKVSHSDALSSYMDEITNSPLKVKGVEISFSIRSVRTDFPNDAKSFEESLVNLRYTLALAAKQHKSYKRFLCTDAQTDLIKGIEYIGDLDLAFSRQEFELYLQPKVSAADPHIITGAEALIRWNHPRDGVLSPDKFINLIVNTHWRARLAIWVIQQSAAALAEIQAIDPNQTVSFNLTAYDVTDLEIFGELYRVQTGLQLKERSLIIELSEAQTQLDPEVLRLSINSIKELGFGIALDDFGQEMSSLSYLANLPLEQVKIDRVFLDEDIKVEAGNKIISFVADFAKLQGWSTVMEGIETQQQAERVRELGIDELQGYYYGKPQPVAEFLTTLKNGIRSVD